MPAPREIFGYFFNWKSLIHYQKKQSEPVKTNATREKSSPLNVSSFSVPEITHPLKKYFSTPLTEKGRIAILNKCREKETTPGQLNREKIIL